DVRAAVEQISARRQLKTKLPEWFANGDVVMGGRIPAEQCSSEQTAQYKRQLVVGESLCDLTGGMGVDFYYMSKGLKRAVYTERQPHLVEAIEHNLNALYGDAVKPEFELRLGDGRELPLPDVDTLYLDPARRAGDGSRLYDIAECEPNVVEWQEELKQHCRKLVVKLSPMVDISRTLQQLTDVTDVHVVALRNECKEVLVEMTGKLSMPLDNSNIRMHCIDYRSNDVVKYEYDYETENEASAKLLHNNQFSSLYEPDVTLLKAGAFKCVCADFDVEKVDVNSHFYVSDELKSSFPGRVFEVEEVISFSSKMLKNMKNKLPKANISARNFPLTADQLRAKTGIKDGGSVYLIATLVASLGNVIMKCRKVVCVLLLFLMAVVSATPSFARKKNKEAKTSETIETLLQATDEESPFLWPRGKSFIYLNESLSPVLSPELPLQDVDTLKLKGSIWNFDAIVSEEDWMGQQQMQLRFIAPSGNAFRFNTGKLLTQQVDTTYRPVLGVLQPLERIERVDGLLRARSLYILINDERVIGSEDLDLEKFVPVLIDSVTIGTEEAPLRVWFTQGEMHASFLTSIQGMREKTTSTTIDRFLSIEDPYLRYSHITKENWNLIKKNQIRQGMTTEEVRLSLGRPLRFEKVNTKAGLIERWYYSNSRVLEFWDNKFMRQGRI
ncbi:MAG: hypothetical protein Q4B58_08960, partial [Bacteroidales bacterium]|nr:hypothetical protein [Bacteroidales bacterium]